jgi:membrane protein
MVRFLQRFHCDSLLRCFANSIQKFYLDDALSYGAALAFFFLLSLFPLLIFLASILAYLPIPNLFPRIVELMSLAIPAEAMRRVENILGQVLDTNLGLLSSGFLGTLWVASLGIDSLINALNIVFQVREVRSYWRRRLLAVELTALIGGMVIVALVLDFLGPVFGSWLPRFLGVQSLFVLLWPYFQEAAVFVFLILSFQLLFFIAPNRRQSFWGQFPGAFLAVILWIGASFILSLFMVRFADYNRVYGTLGAVIALMTWFYVTALAVLLGAELNAELIRRRSAPSVAHSR